MIAHTLTTYKKCTSGPHWHTRALSQRNAATAIERSCTKFRSSGIKRHNQLQVLQLMCTFTRTCTRTHVRTYTHTEMHTCTRFVSYRRARTQLHACTLACRGTHARTRATVARTRAQTYTCKYTLQIQDAELFSLKQQASHRVCACAHGSLNRWEGASAA
jgi:hypothetical protein